MNAPASYGGYVDSVRGRTIKGWAWNSADPAERVRLRILCDGREIGTIVAEIYRADLESAGIGDGRYAFEYAIDPFYPVTSAYSVEVAANGFRLVDSTFRQRKRGDEAFLHSHMDGLPQLRYGFSSASVGALDLDIAGRMIGIWRALPSSGGRFVGAANMWEIHAGDRQKAFVELLARGDAQALARYCVELPRQAITHGLFQGDEHTRTLAAASPEMLNAQASTYWDHFLALAEYLGVRDVECPEQGDWGRAMFADMDDVRTRIDAALGIPIVPPQAFEGLFGLCYPEGVVHRRDIHACYAAHRLSQIAPGRDMAVLEIGGGMGGAAYYARRLGLRDYTIVDLPAISLLQYYFLAKAFGPDEVSFACEPSGFRHDGRIHLVAAELFGDAAIGGFALAFNMDSFPEMGAAVAGDYLRELPAKGVRTLFSINQEARAPLTSDVNGERQACVRELAIRAGFRSRLRYPDWVHKGYVDEVFEDA